MITIKLNDREASDLLSLIRDALAGPSGDSVTPGQLLACARVMCQAGEQYLAEPDRARSGN